MEIIFTEFPKLFDYTTPLKHCARFVFLVLVWIIKWTAHLTMVVDDPYQLNLIDSTSNKVHCKLP